jgi:hypothetical protein
VLYFKQCGGTLTAEDELALNTAIGLTSKAAASPGEAILRLPASRWGLVGWGKLAADWLLPHAGFARRGPGRHSDWSVLDVAVGRLD